MEISEMEEDFAYATLTAQLIGGSMLQPLCYMISFSEMKRLRLVCRDWNIYVSQHPRMRKGRAVFGMDWIHEVNGMNFESAMKWDSIYFRYFPFNNNQVYSLYSKFAGNLVTTVCFKYVKLSCTKFAEFLNALPCIEDVTFDNCNFTLAKLPRLTRNYLGENKTTYLIASCTHTSLSDVPDVLKKHLLPRPRIKSLTFNKENHFPLCLLDLLEQRSHGILEKFTFQETLWSRLKRARCYPSLEKVNRYLTKIIRNNVNTIERFCYCRNRGGERFLLNLVNQGINIHPRELILAMLRSWESESAVSVITRLLNAVDPAFLQHLDISFCHTIPQRIFAQALPTKINLKSLSLESTHFDDPRQAVDLVPVLELMPQLEKLKVRDVPRFRVHQSSISVNYLINIPRTVTSLYIGAGNNLNGQIENLLQFPFTRNFSSLTIEGNSVTDQVMQLLITTLTQLQVLQIFDAKNLTDAGVSGLPLETCKNIILCNQRHILLGDFELDPSVSGVPVSNLQHLKKLSFSGCRKLSDISIIIAFRFSFLREIDLSYCLDVTDFGILFLPKNNPGLERIVIMRNLKITHFGINEVLKAHETIVNIHTSKKNRNRKLGKTTNYEESPRFKYAVTYNKFKERKARPMRTV